MKQHFPSYLCLQPSFGSLARANAIGDCYSSTISMPSNPASTPGGSAFTISHSSN